MIPGCIKLLFNTSFNVLFDAIRSLFHGGRLGKLGCFTSGDNKCFTKERHILNLLWKACRGFRQSFLKKNDFWPFLICAWKLTTKLELEDAFSNNALSWRILLNRKKISSFLKRNSLRRKNALPWMAPFASSVIFFPIKWTRENHRWGKKSTPS